MQKVCCPNCEYTVYLGTEFCPNCGTAIPADAVPAKGSAEAAPSRAYETPAQDYAAAPSFPLKWYHFQVYFQLWAMAALYAFLFLGCMLEDEYPMSYVTGVLYLVLGVFSIVTRFFLTGHKKAAPYMVTGLFSALAVADILFACSVMGEADVETIVFLLFWNLVLAGLNFIYYRKRRSLFTR